MESLPKYIPGTPPPIHEEPRLNRAVVRKFDSHEDADKADREQYSAMTPTERVNTVLWLRKWYYGESAEGFERVCRVTSRA